MINILVLWGRRILQSKELVERHSRKNSDLKNDKIQKMLK